MLKFKSLEDVSMLRKFAVLFFLTSVFPIVILGILYYWLAFKEQLSLDISTVFGLICAAALCALVGFFYMHRSLSNLNRISLEIQEDFKKDPPKEVNIKVKGVNEVSLIVQTFNEIVQKVASNIKELDRTKQQLLQALEREQTLSRTDYLTGIANRRVFYEALELEFSKFSRFKRPFAVVLLDVDNLKKVNDAYGHLTGDKVLQAVAATVKSNIRSIDLVARIGGDEFVILLSEVAVENFEITISRLHNKLQAAMSENNWPVMFSMGAAVYAVLPGNIDDVIRKVDDLLYAVKRGGKNSYKYEIVSI